MSEIAIDLVITNISELLTCAPGAFDLIGRISDSAVAIADGAIVAVGSIHEFDTTGAMTIDASGRVVMPGFVDCHTHVIFGGSRVDEYAAKLTGTDLTPLREKGVAVGITGTMRETAALSVEQLATETLPRLREMLEHGTTTVESKSGYALTVEGELRMLEANRLLAQEQPAEIVSTFLGAHALPDDRTREHYVAEIIEEMIPEVAERHFARFCDVYCEEGYFTLAETEQILRAGLDSGLLPKLHLDQHSHTGAAGFAAEIGCVSVDHLNYTTPDESATLAKAGVVGVPLPGLDFAVGHQHPVDGKALIDGGLEIALATDICPGCWLPSMQLTIALAGRLARLSPAQAIRAATIGAAKAVGMAERIGSIEIGKQADLLLLDTDRHEDLVYKLGHNAVDVVIKKGAVVIDRRR
jgi:imidazolonepropionase